jgi:cytidylate kinase
MAGREAPRACIALSRFPGSGAAALGIDVARRLDFDFFGIEIVDRMARDSGLPRRLAAAFDERVRNSIERYVVDAFREGAFVETDYLRHLVRTIRSIGESGSAVLLGRGAPYILPAERALRVLVVAPRKTRLENLAKALGLDVTHAEQQLIREDEERRRFLGHHFRVDPDDPTRYDLVVNTGMLGHDAACEAVVSAYRARFPAQRAGRHDRV